MTSFAVSVERKSFEKLRANLDKLGKGSRKAIEEAIETATINTHADAVRAVPADTGRLKASLHFIVNKLLKVVGVVYTDVLYAPYVELGTRPHFPPPKALAGWARRHGLRGLEFVIARSMSMKGTKPRPFLGPAFETHSRRFESYAREAMSKTIKEATK